MILGSSDFFSPQYHAILPKVIRHFERERELPATTRWFVPQVCYRKGRNDSEMYVPMSGLPVFTDKPGQGRSVNKT